VTAAVGLIVLAAGGSSRLGHPKQLLPYRGRTLLRHAAETALLSVCRPVVVVLGAQPDRLRPELSGLDVRVVDNPGWEAGMGSSIRAGLAALETASPDGAGLVLMLCDQPLVSAAALDALVQAHADTGSPFVASAYADTRGVPAFFSRALFPELRALPDAQGAKPLLARHAAETVALPLPMGVWDVDTEADYNRLFETAAEEP
jgi:molybdenum cofactor cytidylyltransferase